MTLLSKKRLAECKVDCLLYKDINCPFMPMSGNTTAPILFVGEAPGKDEDAAGIQFVGRAGQLLRSALEKFHITDFALDNICACRPPNNRTPSKKEIEACLPRLLDNMNKMPNLKLVVPLGNVALQALTGMKSITKISGKLFPLTHSVQVLPITHPSYILRNQHESKTFFDHIGRIPNALTGSLTNVKDYGEYTIITSMDLWTELSHKIEFSKVFSYDLETTGLNPFAENFQVKCISFSIQPYESYILPIDDKGEALDWEEVGRSFRTIFNSKRIGKCGHNIKFDNLCMWVFFGIQVRGTIWDTSIVAHLLNENESHGLKELAWKYTKIGGYESHLSTSVDKAEGEELYKYCGADSDVTERLRRIQIEAMKKEPELTNLMTTLILPVSSVLTEMEYTGIRIDPLELDDCLGRTDNYLNMVIKKIEKEDSVLEFEKASEMKFNPNSHTQLREILFKYEGLQPLKFTDKTKSPSTDRETLDVLSVESNLCKLLSTYSLFSTIKSKSLGELYNYKTKDNRIHTNFSLDLTVTGRTSSYKPNLQNVPKGKKDVVEIRKVFIPDDGYLLAEFDMNQHELRCMAEEAQDWALLEALNGDVHLATASAVLGKKPEEVTSEERSAIGKVINFSLIYKISAYGLSRRLKCDEDTAGKYIRKFFDKYYKTLSWMQRTEEFVKRNKYVRSRTGRYRRFPVWDEVSENLIREAVNMPIQSLAGDILLYGLIGVNQFLKKNKLRSFIVLEIHDSIMLNIHNSELDIISEIKNIMVNFFKQYIPFESGLKVDAKIGLNWLDLEEVN